MKPPSNCANQNAGCWSGCAHTHGQQRRAILYARWPGQNFPSDRHRAHRARTPGENSMPLKLRPPRAGKTPNFEIRGTHLGVRVETSSGTHKRSLALKQLRKVEECIEQNGQYPAPEPAAHSGQPTFLSAANAYMQAGGRRKYVAPLIKHFRERPLSEIDQNTIDAAATAIYPHVSNPATQNCYVYTPVSAILHHALGDKCPVIRRPKGAKGKIKTDFMWPDDAFAIIAEADKIDAEFGLYLRLLIYTGIRKSEGLNLLAADVRPEERAAWLRDS